jgi:hypothetical protein
VEQLEEAAQEQEGNFIIDGGDQPQEETTETAPITESAPVEEESQSAETKEPVDNFQSRINKVTADKYAEKRRADELQSKLDAYNSAPKQEATQPTLEGHDYDEDSFNKANIDYQVQQQLKVERGNQAQQVQQAENQKIQAAFDVNVVKLGKDDFVEKMGAVPILPNGVADALVELPNGPELIYHLGTHLDAADAIANMTPAAAMMELGKISVSMSATKKVKTSAAPEPIQTLKHGSAISKERGPVGATYD